MEIRPLLFPTSHGVKGQFMSFRIHCRALEQMPLAPLQELQLLAVSVNGLELETIDQRLKRHVSAIGSVSGKGSCCSTQKLSKENSENHEENENMQQIHRSCMAAFDECPDCVKSNSDFAEELQCMIKVSKQKVQ